MWSNVLVDKLKFHSSLVSEEGVIILFFTGTTDNDGNIVFVSKVLHANDPQFIFWSY